MEFNADGTAVVEHRFLGLYTKKALAARPWEIPYVQRKIAALQQRSGLNPSGHSGKAFLQVIESLPREDLFQASQDELFALSMGVLNLQERVRTRLFVRRDRFGRFYSCLVFVPRDRFNPEVRERIEQMLRRAYHGERFDSTVQISESSLARLHVVVRPKPGDRAEVDVAALEDKLKQLVRNWLDELRDQLVSRHGEDRGLKLLGKFGRALPTGYIEAASAAVAAGDVEQAAALSGPDDLRMALYRPRKRDEQNLHFKLFKYGSTIALSDALPMLENFGLRVLSEHPHEIEVHGQSIWIQDFEVQPPVGVQIDLEQVREPFQTAFGQVWREAGESDSFNRLVLTARLTHRQVAVLRGYGKFLLQTRLPFSQSYVEQAINKHPLIARLLVALFEARFDPDREAADDRLIESERLSLDFNLDAIASDEQAKQHGVQFAAVAALRGKSRDASCAGISTLIRSLLEEVSSIDEDRILRGYLGMVHATLRTNYYQFDLLRDDGRHKDYISFKFDSSQVPELPKPIPYREIFVYSPRVEGTHLRFGKVARGGLRWSDRREDFRTEVLGLVKAQQVKNTVIVPVGAKGGFYVKRPPLPSDRDAWLAEGVACYRTFISGLLDITDNVVAGQIVPAPRLVAYDEPDPYMVVAADKGTATFSDIANSIAINYGHWLGDAFASGGSKGYDHKKMGITAKGAWESVKRHFRALGKDCQSEPFTCAGVGDMSGDVFGNGMLLSRQIKLQAAFDHRHIFLDPNPDPEISFVERERLFALPRSSWEDYNKTLISAGGGIWPRSAKTIALSPQIKAALDISANQLSPNDLMKAILKSPVELLWNGGIGTYVKAESETHEQVGDRANNALRVNGGELRCKIVGEGGNLGATQRGRIEAALRAGVLLNTDFIDNSAGVDTSDHEVNIKILLNEALEGGEIHESERDELLISMTDEVGEMVIRDNYRQNLALDLMQSLAITRLGAKQHYIRVLEDKGMLDRELEFLPSDDEFADRKARGLGLTRPELSILLSYSKIDLYQQLVESDVPEDPYLSKELQLYFPTPLRERFAQTMERHRLKREIIATQVTNSMINRMGSTFVLRMQEDSGASSAQVAKAYSIAREVSNARDWWQEIDTVLNKVDRNGATAVQLRIWNLLRNLTRWLLNPPTRKLDIANAVHRYSKGFQELAQGLDGVLPQIDRDLIEHERKDIIAAGFEPELAAQIARCGPLSSVFDVIEVAAEHQCDLLLAARVYFGLGEALHLRWLQAQIEKLPVEGRWHANARGVMRDRLFVQHRALTGQVLLASANAEDAVERWMDDHRANLAYTLGMFDEMHSIKMDYATMSVAIRRLGQLVQVEGGEA
jgi:glutamate dehydrogenase